MSGKLFEAGEQRDVTQLRTHRRQAVGSLQIVERWNQFQVRRGRAILSVHDNFRDAEDAALRAWSARAMTMKSRAGVMSALAPTAAREQTLQDRQL
jgi:hypothetical protein